MAFSIFIVISIALSTFGCLYADANDIHCEEPSLTNAPTKICVNRPPNFAELRDKMDELVEQDKDWNGFQPEPVEEVHSKYGGDEQDCETITTLEQPYMLKTNTSSGVSTHYVVQSKYFTQTIRYTRCRYINRSCLENISGLSIKTTCAEKLGAISVYVYDHDLHKIVYKTIVITVCCSCEIEKK